MVVVLMDFNCVCILFTICYDFKKMFSFLIKLKLVLKMTKEENVREKVMRKYLENSNRSCKSIAKELQIHPYTICCVIQHFSQAELIKCKSGAGRRRVFKIKNWLENLLMGSRLA